MHKITITIDATGQAFKPDPFAQLADILESIAINAKDNGFNDHVYDANGETCGTINIE